jgi:hypothetical protein
MGARKTFVIIAALILVAVTVAVAKLIIKPQESISYKDVNLPARGTELPSFIEDYEEMRAIWHAYGVDAAYLHHAYNELLTLPDENLEGMWQSFEKFTDRNDISPQALMLAYAYQNLIDVVIYGKQLISIQNSIRNRSMCDNLTEYRAFQYLAPDMVALTDSYISQVNMFVGSWPEDANRIRLYTTGRDLAEAQLLMLEFESILGDIEEVCASSSANFSSVKINVSHPSAVADLEELELDESLLDNAGEEGWQYTYKDSDDVAVSLGVYLGAGRFAFLYGYPEDATNIPLTFKEATDMLFAVFSLSLVITSLYPSRLLGKGIILGSKYFLRLANAPVVALTGRAKVLGKLPTELLEKYKDRLGRLLLKNPLASKVQRYLFTPPSRRPVVEKWLQRDILRTAKVMQVVAKIGKEGKLKLLPTGAASNMENLPYVLKARTALKKRIKALYIDAVAAILYTHTSIVLRRRGLEKLLYRLKDKLYYARATDVMEAAELAKAADTVEKTLAQLIVLEQTSLRLLRRMRGMDRWFKSAIGMSVKHIITNSDDEIYKAAEKAARQARLGVAELRIVRPLNLIIGFGAGTYFVHESFFPVIFKALPGSLFEASGPVKIHTAAIVPLVKYEEIKLLQESLQKHPRSDVEKFFGDIPDINGIERVVEMLKNVGVKGDYLVWEEITVNPARNPTVMVNYLGNIYKITISSLEMNESTGTSNYRFELSIRLKDGTECNDWAEESIKGKLVIVSFPRCENFAFLVRKSKFWEKPLPGLPGLTLYAFTLPANHVHAAADSYAKQMIGFMLSHIDKTINETKNEYWFLEVNSDFYPIADGALGYIGFLGFEGKGKKRVLSIVKGTEDGRLKLLYLIVAHKMGMLEELWVKIRGNTLFGVLQPTTFFDYYRPKKELYLDELTDGLLYKYVEETEAGSREYLVKLNAEPIDLDKLSKDNVVEELFYSVASGSADAIYPYVRYPYPVRVDKGRMLVSEIPSAGLFVNAIVLSEKIGYAKKISEPKAEFSSATVAGLTKQVLLLQQSGVSEPMISVCNATNTGAVAYSKYGFDRLVYSWGFYGDDSFDAQACVADFDGYEGKGLFCDATQHTISLLKNAAGYAFYLQRAVKNMPEEIKKHIPFDEIGTIKDLYRVARAQTLFSTGETTFLFFNAEDGLLEAPYDKNSCPWGPDFSGVLNMLEEGIELGAYGEAQQELKRCYGKFYLQQDVTLDNLLIEFGTDTLVTDTVKQLEILGGRRVDDKLYFLIADYAGKLSDIRSLVSDVDVRKRVFVGVVNKPLGEELRRYTAINAVSWTNKTIDLVNTYFLDRPVLELLIADTYDTRFKEAFWHYYQKDGSLGSLMDLLESSGSHPLLLSLQSSWWFLPQNLKRSGLYEVEIDGLAHINDPYGEPSVRISDITVSMKLVKDLEELDRQLGTSYASNPLLSVGFDAPLELKTYVVKINDLKTEAEQFKLSKTVSFKTTPVLGPLVAEINIKRRPADVVDGTALKLSLTHTTEKPVLRVEFMPSVPVVLAISAEQELNTLYYGLSERFGASELYESHEDYGSPRTLFKWVVDGASIVKDLVDTSSALDEPCGLSPSMPVARLNLENAARLLVTVAALPINSQMTLVCADDSVQLLGAYYNNAGDIVTVTAQLRGNRLFGEGGNVIPIRQVEEPSLQQYLENIKEKKMCVEANGDTLMLKWDMTIFSWKE